EAELGGPAAVAADRQLQRHAQLGHDLLEVVAVEWHGRPARDPAGRRAAVGPAAEVAQDGDAERRPLGDWFAGSGTLPGGQSDADLAERNLGHGCPPPAGETGTMLPPRRPYRQPPVRALSGILPPCFVATGGSPVGVGTTGEPPVATERRAGNLARGQRL